MVVVAEDPKQWQRILEASGWAGETLGVAVDSEITELADVAIDIVRALGDEAEGDFTLVGVGPGGRGAQLMALAGRATALVLVDGLPYRFAGPGGVIAERTEWMRRRVAGEFPAIPRIESRSFAERAAAAVGVPTLVVETPASGSPEEVVDAVVAAFPRSTLARVQSVEEAAAQVVSWMGA